MSDWLKSPGRFSGTISAKRAVICFRYFVSVMGVKSSSPRRDAQNVAVHGRHAQAEADGRDRPGGVLPDARQRKKRLEIRRKRTAVL